MTECIFGWGKQHGTMRKTKHRGIAAVAADFLRSASPNWSRRSPRRIEGTKARSIAKLDPHLRGQWLSF
jgi:hypothetical protein